jgi:hypothetical protein
MKFRYIIIWCVGLMILASTATLHAQMPTDGLMMKRREWCHALVYAHSSWDQYWEGTLFRDNPNLGTVTTQSVQYMGAYGINDRFNVMLGLPYVWTQPSAGQFAGQNGLQDLTVSVKYEALRKQWDKAKLSVFGVASGATPVSRYMADFLPFSIGSGARTATARVVADWRRTDSWFATVQGGYTFRSRITIDRSAYQFEGRVYNTNIVPMFNVADATLRLGYAAPRFHAEAHLEQFAVLGGDDIRRNDMPFPTNRMSALSAGLGLRYFYKQYSVMVNANRVLQGRNVGQSLGFNAGLLYTLNMLNNDK